MVRLRDLGTNTPTGVPYIEDVIMAMIRKGKQQGYIPRVSRVLAGQGRNAIFIKEPRGTYTDAEIDKIKEDEIDEGSGSGSGGGRDDESGKDEDAGRD
ncbi:hypothetical protein Tco_0546857 [Tanacetum coccineum]